jgi:CheY-like chemotaxis protein
MGITALLVDDSRPFLKAAQSLLAREGIDVLEVASTTAETLELVARLEPDAVLVDVNLGAESGFDLARRLAEDEHGRRATVILMSTHAEAEYADLIAESSVAGFLTKSRLSGDAIRLIHEGAKH